MKRNMFTSIAAASLMAMAMGPGFMTSGVLRPRAPKIPYQRELDRGLNRKQKQRALRKARRRQEQGGNLLAKVRHRRAKGSAFQDAVNKLTNWQRNQWAKAKYPGLGKGLVDEVKPFVGMVRYG